MEKNEHELIIIGGGAAGLLAGVAAAQSGLRVLMIERLRQPGRRLLATGGGRCNLTRDLSCRELLAGYYDRKNFVRTAMYNFTPQALREYLAKIGLRTIVEPDGGVYPVSQQAGEVLQVLLTEYERGGGNLLCATAVEQILTAGGRVCGVRTGAEVYLAEKVLLAGGGCSMPELGANGSAFVLARELGHAIVQPVAGLVGLVIPELADDTFAGLSLEAVINYGSGKNRSVFPGAVLFTHRGLSGPAVLNLSRVVSRVIAAEGAAEITVCWGGYAISFWEEEVAQMRKKHGHRTVGSWLGGYFPRRFAEYICRKAGIDGEVTFAEFTRESCKSLLELLVQSRYAVSRSEGFARAMVTSGGVSTAEVDPRSMQSRIVPGLYFAGEVLDVDGLCGGYNLQWAFASAKLAVDACSKG